MANTFFMEHTDESEKALASLLEKIPTDQSKLMRWLLVQADKQIKSPLSVTFTPSKKGHASK